VGEEIIVHANSSGAQEMSGIRLLDLGVGLVTVLFLAASSLTGFPLTAFQLIAVFTVPADSLAPQAR
jgi:hypothetical protein